MNRKPKKREGWRRGFRLAVILGIGAVVVTLFIWQVNVQTRFLDRILVVYLAEYQQAEKNEQRLNQVLESVDKALDRVSRDLQTKTVQYSLPYLSGIQFLAPFELYEFNRTHKFRNGYTLLKTELRNKGKKVLTAEAYYHLEDDRYFTIQFLGDKVAISGAYDLSARALLIGERFDPTNLLDVLGLYYNLEQIGQDINLRRRAQTPEQRDRYLQFVKREVVGTNKVIGSFAQEAYFKQVVVLDILTDGRVHRDAAIGRFEGDWYLRFLNARADQTLSIDLLLRIAKEVFTSGSTLGNYSSSYVRYVNDLFRRNGYAVYEVTPDLRFRLASQDI